MSTDDQSRRPERLLGGDDVHERASRIEEGRRVKDRLDQLRKEAEIASFVQRAEALSATADEETQP